MTQVVEGMTGEVLLLLSDSESAGLFAEMLARSRRVAIGESESAIAGRYDLGIVDGPMLQRVWRRIAERKRAETALLPFLLVTTPQDVGLFARFLWTAVDELIQTPVQTPELLARVDVLLRVREASVRLRDHAEERFRQFFETDPAGKWVAAPDGRILLCNPALAGHLGFASVEEACRHTWGDVIADPVAAADFGTLLAAGTALDGYEMELTRTDGSRIHVLQHAVPRLEEGRLREMQGYLVDVSERRRLERRLHMVDRLEAIGKLAGGIAHNFNNMLSTILGYSDLLTTDMPMGDPRRQEVEEIRKAALRSAELTRQLLAFSRQQVLQPSELRLNDLVAAMERTFRGLLGDRVDVVLAFDGALGPVVADRSQLEQVLLNLVLNARDALTNMDGGEVRLETAALRLEAGDRALPGVEIPPGSYAGLRVHDTGRGMDAATRGRAFEPFFTTKRAGEGIGLGLATAYGIVKQSGGFISIDSEPGRGTTVSVYLPVARVAGPRPAAPGTPTRDGDGDETLLLVEDEDSVRVMAARILRQRGYTVIEAASGGEAIALLGRYDGPLDLLVTDIIMPEVSGIELANRLPGLRDGVRVLFVSGYSEADPALTQAAGGVTLLNKPFRAGELLSAVRRVLDAPPAEPELVDPSVEPAVGAH
jgi:two-component system, cell cycle sensor histidine kinase and response regulator CckA